MLWKWLEQYWQEDVQGHIRRQLSTRIYRCSTELGAPQPLPSSDERTQRAEWQDAQGVPHR